MEGIKGLNNQIIDCFLEEGNDAIINNDFSLLKEKISALSYDSVQLLIDSLPDYIILVDSDHHVVMANSKVKHDGYSPEEILGGYCPKVIHGSNSPIPECPLEDAVESGCSKEREFYDKNTNRWFLSVVYKTPFISNSNKDIYFHQLQDITDRKKSKQELEQSIEKINNILEQGIQAIVKLVEKRDPYTAGHQKNVSIIAREIAKDMGLSEDIIETVTIAGLLHDIGKIVVPIEILNKPSKLNKHEFNLIKMHPVEGYQILKDIEFPNPIAETILHHHERLDGSGYPDDLSGEDIEMSARIIGVADVVDAMSSHRPYRPALGIDKAIKELSKNKGILYDEKVVDICIGLFRNKNFDIYLK